MLTRELNSKIPPLPVVHALCLSSLCCVTCKLLLCDYVWVFELFSKDAIVDREQPSLSDNIYSAL